MIVGGTVHPVRLRNGKMTVRTGHVGLMSREKWRPASRLMSVSHEGMKLAVIN